MHRIAIFVRYPASAKPEVRGFGGTVLISVYGTNESRFWTRIVARAKWYCDAQMDGDSPDSWLGSLEPSLEVSQTTLPPIACVFAFKQC
jgi:hypothetical protein